MSEKVLTFLFESVVAISYVVVKLSRIMERGQNMPPPPSGARVNADGHILKNNNKNVCANFN